MLKQADDAGKAFEKNVYFSIIKGNASIQITDKPNKRSSNKRQDRQIKTGIFENRKPLKVVSRFVTAAFWSFKK
jgi:hypothetical protein